MIMLDAKAVLEYTRGVHVLYVEDEAVVAEQTMLLLNDYFERVDYAHDGKEGLDKYNQAREASDEYDLIITDINMPNMNGIELCEAVYEINPVQKIIVISAHNEVGYLSQLINMGVDRFISKPVEIKNIMKVFYSVCQSISDHKQLQTYYDEIENLNISLIKKNSELEKAFRMYDKMVLKEKLHKQDTVHSHPHHAEIVNEDPAPGLELSDLVHNDLPELLGLHKEMDALILNMIMKEDTDNIKELGILLNRYSAILSPYRIFNDLKASFQQLSDTVLHKAIPEDKQQMGSILSILESFLFTLKRWQNSWTSEQERSTNFFDSSLLSDINTIISLWSQEGSSEEREFF